MTTAVLTSHLQQASRKFSDHAIGVYIVALVMRLIILALAIMALCSSCNSVTGLFNSAPPPPPDSFDRAIDRVVDAIQ